jgi:hypothetical protein
MNPQNVHDICVNNALVRRQLLDLLDQITPEQASAVTDEGSWTIEQIVEHIAVVNTGAANICQKLVQGARDAAVPSSGRLAVSETFGQKTAEVRDVRLEAPERVHPTGSMSIADARAKLTENEEIFGALKNDMAAFELKDHTFPHPYFGQLTAAEWLMIAGGHERTCT